MGPRPRDQKTATLAGRAPRKAVAFSRRRYRQVRRDLPNHGKSGMIDVKGIGRHMPRARHERGHVKEAGKRVKQWVGEYHVYEKQADGTEKRVHRAEVLGPKAGMPK